MELDFSKLIYFKNKEKAIIGKKYYFLFDISLEDVKDITAYNEPEELEDISMCDKCCFYDGYGSRYSFIYPAE